LDFKSKQEVTAIFGLSWTIQTILIWINMNSDQMLNV
jgi:hypothetical protein